MKKIIAMLCLLVLFTGCTQDKKESKKETGKDTTIQETSTDNDNKKFEVKILESTYHYFLKTIIKTHCIVHQFINIKALEILKSDDYIKEAKFFTHYMPQLNRGAIWADQDFKSSNHFYNPDQKKGLFGRKNAMELGVEYYFKALSLWHSKQYKKAIFYLGAALHIMQDMCVPQHANIRLLDNHRQYETFIKHTYRHVKEFQVDRGAYLLDSIEDYIRFNAGVAIKTYDHYHHIPVLKLRYYKMTRCILPLAIKTTAGAMVMFFHDVSSIPPTPKPSSHAFWSYFGIPTRT